MNKYTPGPWHVTPSGGIAGDGGVIVINDFETCSKSEQKPINNGFGSANANARLMAAAPELLEALQAAERELLRLKSPRSALTTIRFAIQKAGVS